ncbi:alpha-amylase family glycosyl hydrolase [Algibacillus agarilyticus]|uniref:alpha-amylase family glycosyl hydrolase n=1 Tax=Algibacillus agarilyticus TaxID=2234133 RepID=UPI000DD0C21B|nr:alpha-amylase family glycosyl hydrolase [Algibacillus agarilyticus]
MSTLEWWRGAVLYQVYPRSFMDSNNDGIGDLAGITSKLPYIADLGVDAIWISPFYKSPMADFGYDVSDHCSVDPIFGDLNDFSQLVQKAHSLNLKVLIDAVLNHTSEQHEWFNESRQNQDNAKADWYVWADPKEDGTPPNNWLSIFGGPAWAWDPRRKQYYLHNFLAAQPDLNYHHSGVRKAVLENIEFWLKLGVDGIRVDAANFCCHDLLLRDNPPRTKERLTVMGIRGDNPYAYQEHLFNHTQPENLEFISELRQLLNQYPGTTSLAEISSEDSLATMAEYTKGQHGLHMAYSFELLNDKYSAAHIRQTIERLEDKLEDGWPCWALGNHDVERVVTRWDRSQRHEDKAKMLNALLGSLKGSVCVYQGEELGLPQADIQFEDMQDPYGINFWPTFAGRDGCRTPLPWNRTMNAGFSLETPWLPIPDEHIKMSIRDQQLNSESVINAFKSFMKWRATQPALIEGDIKFLDAPEPILLFCRHAEDRAIVCGFNLSGDSQQFTLPSHLQAHQLVGHEFNNTLLDESNQLRFLPYGVFFAVLNTAQCN